MSPGRKRPSTAGQTRSTRGDRALRKGLEDGKDEPGAADCYYGEMEMRRFAKQDLARRPRQAGHVGVWLGTRAEHLLFWLYWLVSGYGLRASRALAALAATVTLGAGHRLGSVLIVDAAMGSAELEQSL